MNFLKLIISLPITIYIQIFLSTKKSKIMGLILPIISFAISLLNLVQSMSFLKGLIAFILFNIPTVIFLIIYVICRKNIDERNKNSY